MRRFNAVLSDILSEEFDALISKHATKDISDEQEQSASLLRVHFITGQCFDSTWNFYSNWHWTYIISEICSVS